MVKNWEVSSNFKTLPFIFTERITDMIEDYPANSAKSKQEAKENRKNLQPVVTEPVNIRPKRNKVLRLLFKNDFQDIRKGLTEDYVYPKIQELTWAFVQACIDGVSNTLKMMIYDNYRPTTRSSTPTDRYSYSKYYGDQAVRPAPSMTTEINYDEFSYTDRGNAEAVLRELQNLIVTTKAASVLDLYNLSNVPTSNYTLQDWGWTDLSFAEVRSQGDEYIIALPKAKPLKR